MQNELKPTINKPVFLTSALFILLLVVFTIAARPPPRTSST